MKASIISQKLNRTETNMMNDLLNQKEQRLMRMNKYLRALEARKDGALNNDPIFAEWEMDALILSALTFDGDNIPAADVHYTAPYRRNEK